MVIFLKAFPPQIIGVMVVQIALLNGLLMIGGAFLGMALDRQFGTRPLLTVLLPLLGALASVFLAYLLAKRAVMKSRKAYLEWAAGDQPAEETSAVASAALHDAHSAT
jgi:F0F1-type ATP synthase assembly protein I